MRLYSKTRFIIKFLIIGLILNISYLFFWGRLNFICPWMIGFDRIETKSSVIFYHKGEVNLKNFPEIDSLIVKVENFHNLKFQKKVQIIISSNIKEHRRFNGHNVMFVTQPFLGRVYILYSREYFQTKVGALNSYLQHELSHSIVNQNITNSKLIGYPLWFLEGIATYSSGMLGYDGYPPLDTVRQRISRGCVINPNDWGKFGMAAKGKTVNTYPFNDLYKYAYSEFAFIIDDLIEKYGEPKLISLLHLSLIEQKFDIAFRLIYKIEFKDYFHTLINDANYRKQSVYIMRGSEQFISSKLAGKDSNGG